MQINHTRRGGGKPLLLVHGLGGSWQSWRPVLDALTAERSVVAIDLPGFGKSPPLDGRVTLAALADAVAGFLHVRNLTGIDAAGISLGARLVLDLARRGGVLGTVVALSPLGFWSGMQHRSYHGALWLSVQMARALRFAMPALAAHPGTRTLLMRRFSARPHALAPALVLEEMHNLAQADSLEEALCDVVFGEPAAGAARGEIAKPLVIGWGRDDRLCHPSQAARAQALFPDATLHWFEGCGHLAHWDAPRETAQLILDSTAVEPPFPGVPGDLGAGRNPPRPAQSWNATVSSRPSATSRSRLAGRGR